MRMDTIMMRRVRPVLAAGAMAIALWAVPALAEGVKLRPIDQAGTDPSFAKFRSALLEAVRRRDTDFVVGQTSEDIKISFGGDEGREAFLGALTGAEDWQGEAYWAELQRVLEMGAVRLEGGAFCMPYLACMNIPGCPECDPYDTVVVTSADTVARAKPRDDAPVVARLAYDVLQMNHEVDGGEGWISVLLPGDRSGFVPAADARMAIDYRARFEKRGGTWRMTVFIAGD